MTHLAAVTHDPDLIAWCKRLLGFFLSRGTDFGWIPESMTYPRRSETCAVADVLDMTAYMAQCGYPEYWDVVERFTRNYIREAQFFITPEYEALYRELHPGEEGERGLAMARDYEGGWQGAMGLTDRRYGGNEMDMMGCCLPEGMRAIHTAWAKTVVRGGGEVRVNMAFDRDAPEARVTSFLPNQGRVTVMAKVPADFLLRPPAWAAKDSVRAYRNGEPVPIEWRDAYVDFGQVPEGTTLSVTYPLVAFVQHQPVKNSQGEPDRHLTVTWRGNTVMKLEPKGDRLPLYQEVPRPLPPLR